jgi:hypothetical protein
MEKDKGKRKGMVSHILDTKGWFWCAVDIFRWCLLLILPTKYICRYCTESFEIFTVHATITDGQSVGDLPLEIQTKHVRRYSSREKKKLARFPLLYDCWCLFFIILFPTESTTERRITDDQYSDRRIPSVNILPTSCVYYTNGMNPSVKLFNGVVC